jgi:DNA-binding transcriptional LysR family regulator
LVDEDCVIVLPQAHALANSATVPIALLAKETFILCNRDFSPAMFDSIHTACSRAGFRPKLGHQVPQALATVPMVAAGFGVSIVPRSFSEFRFAGVNYIDFEGNVPRSAIGLACRRDERSSTIKNVVKAARLAKLAPN